MLGWIKIPQSFVRLCAVFTCLVVFSILLSDKGKQSAMVENLLDIFPETRGDGSRLTWSHAVNSRSHLEDALKSKSMILEADVSMSSIPGRKVPIMAHPPATLSDLTLEEWLTEVVKYAKGIKLDFKMMEALEPSLGILKKFQPQIKYPLLLNADILPGPGNPLSTPLQARHFISACRDAFPSSTLSLGWTTYVDSSVVNPVYDGDMISAMVQTLNDARVSQPVTFAIRACIAKNSVGELQDLLRTFPIATFTIWSSPGDPVSVKDLLKFRSHFNLKALYFDLPSPLKEEFLEGISIA